MAGEDASKLDHSALFSVVVVVVSSRSSSTFTDCSYQNDQEAKGRRTQQEGTWTRPFRSLLQLLALRSQGKPF